MPAGRPSSSMPRRVAVHALGSRVPSTRARPPHPAKPPFESSPGALTRAIRQMGLLQVRWVLGEGGRRLGQLCRVLFRPRYAPRFSFAAATCGAPSFAAAICGARRPIALLSARCSPHPLCETAAAREPHMRGSPPTISHTGAPSWQFGSKETFRGRVLRGGHVHEEQGHEGEGSRRVVLEVTFAVGPCSGLKGAPCLS